jgi:hypothetical protein
MIREKNIFWYAVRLVFFASVIILFSAPRAIAANPWRGAKDIAKSFAGGRGTEEDPYLISDPPDRRGIDKCSLLLR